MSGIASVFYRAIFKRSSTIFLTAVVSAVVIERTIDTLGEDIFHQMNKGVR